MSPLGHRKPQSGTLIYLVCLAFLLGSGCGSASADQGTSNNSTNHSGSAPNKSEASAAPSPSTLVTALGNVERVNALIKEQKVDEALALTKSTQADIDKFLINTFNQPNAVSEFPPDVVAAMKRNNAEPLCAFLNKELATEQGLQNIKNLLSIRNNLKRIVTALSK